MTPTQEYEKYMRATDKWIKDEMIKHDVAIRVDIEQKWKERHG